MSEEAKLIISMCLSVMAILLLLSILNGIIRYYLLSFRIIGNAISRILSRDRVKNNTHIRRTKGEIKLKIRNLKYKLQDISSRKNEIEVELEPPKHYARREDAWIRAGQKEDASEDMSHLAGYLSDSSEAQAESHQPVEEEQDEGLFAPTPPAEGLFQKTEEDLSQASIPEPVQDLDLYDEDDDEEMPDLSGLV